MWCWFGTVIGLVASDVIGACLKRPPTHKTPFFSIGQRLTSRLLDLIFLLDVKAKSSSGKYSFWTNFTIKRAAFCISCKVTRVEDEGVVDWCWMSCTNQINQETHLCNFDQDDKRFSSWARAESQIEVLVQTRFFKTSWSSSGTSVIFNSGHWSISL